METCEWVTGLRSELHTRMATHERVGQFPANTTHTQCNRNATHSDVKDVAIVGQLEVTDVVERSLCAQRVCCPPLHAISCYNGHGTCADIDLLDAEDGCVLCGGRKACE